jgi:hypothetical protein
LAGSLKSALAEPVANGPREGHSPPHLTTSPT